MKTKLFYGILMTILVISMVGCQSAATPTSAVDSAEPASAGADVEPVAAATEASGEPFVIAIAGPMTGDGAQQGQYAMVGAEIARDEINAAGGINGRPIELVAMDDKGDSTEAATVAQRLVDDESVDVVVGHMWSSATLAAMPIYQAAGMPVITPTASNSAVTQGDWDIVRICLPDNVQAPQMAALLVNNEGGKKVAVFYSNDDYGRGILDQSKSVIEALGAEIVYEAPYKPNIDKDFTVQLTSAVDAGADSILLGTQQAEGGLIMSQAAQMGIFDSIPSFIGNSGLLYQLFLDRLDSESEKHVLIIGAYDPFSERDVVKNFVATFEEKQNSLPSETASYTYDALYMIRDAYANGATRETLIDTIKGMTFTNLVVGDNVSFDDKGDREDKSMSIIGVQDRKFVSTGEKIDLTGVTFGE